MINIFFTYRFPNVQNVRVFRVSLMHFGMGTGGDGGRRPDRANGTHLRYGSVPVCVETLKGEHARCA